MKTQKNKSPRAKLLAALFKKAAQQGINQKDLRENIAQQVNSKRLSKSSLQEIVKVIDHITGGKQTRPRKYAPGIAGLKYEIKDLAMTRWGDEWEGSLNKFCKGFGVDRYQFLNIAIGKVVKKRLVELSRKAAESAEKLNIE
ncbi:MAG: hypothetical protein OEV42_19415 [Deltaproteobacteria bacterium]|nr:hypothetical protein [Deltaproteobacteria bacterium]